MAARCRARTRHVVVGGATTRRGAVMPPSVARESRTVNSLAHRLNAFEKAATSAKPMLSATASILSVGLDSSASATSRNTPSRSRSKGRRLALQATPQGAVADTEATGRRHPVGPQASGRAWRASAPRAVRVMSAAAARGPPSLQRTSRSARRCMDWGNATHFAGRGRGTPRSSRSEKRTGHPNACSVPARWPRSACRK